MRPIRPEWPPLPRPGKTAGGTRHYVDSSRHSGPRAEPRACDESTEMGLQRVVRDAQLAAGAALVVVAALQDQPRIAAGPLAHRVPARIDGRMMSS